MLLVGAPRIIAGWVPVIGEMELCPPPPVAFLAVSSANELYPRPPWPRPPELRPLRPLPPRPRLLYPPVYAACPGTLICCNGGVMCSAAICVIIAV